MICGFKVEVQEDINVICLQTWEDILQKTW